MDVLFVHFGDDWLAGSERYLLEMMSRSRRYGINPTLWCNSGLLYREALAQKISCFHDAFEYYFDYGRPTFSPKTYLRQVIQGIELINSTSATIVHCNGAAPAQWMIPASAITKRPVVVNIHARYLKRSRYFLGVHLADRIVAVSAAVRRPFLDDGINAEKAVVIPNGFDSKALLTGCASALRSELQISANAVVGAIVASLIPLKGHDVLFEAIALAGRLNPPFRLLVIGDGPDRSMLEELARGLPVHFLGYRSDVGAILRDAADFLISPSRHEAFGRVIVEAAICGIPAVGSKVGGIPEIIEDGVTGMLVPAESPAALAEAMKRMVTDSDLRKRMGDMARIRSEQYDLDATVTKLISEYECVITERARRQVALISLCGRTLPYWRLLGRRRGNETKVVPRRAL